MTGSRTVRMELELGVPLLLHQFHPAIFCSSFLCVVGRNRSVRAVPVGFETGSTHAVIAHKRLCDRIRPALGELHVGLQPSHIVRMPDYVHLQVGGTLQELGNFAYSLRRLGFDIGFAGIEVDAIHCGVARGLEVV